MEKLKEWMYKRSLKQQLMEVFRKAGLYREHQTRGGKSQFIQRFMLLIL